MAAWRVPVLIVGALALVAAVVCGFAFFPSSDERPPTRLSVVWGGSEGHPSCLYDATRRTVTAKLRVDGKAPRPTKLTVTVTAYADENTSVPVGSASRSMHVRGPVHLRILMPIPVEKAPHVDEDGESACRLATDY